MSIKAIEIIREAELAANKMKDEAREIAKKSVNQENEYGQVIIGDAVRKANAELVEMIKKADEVSEKNAKDTESATEKKKTELKEQAESRMQEAVQLVVERIVSS